MQNSTTTTIPTASLIRRLGLVGYTGFMRWDKGDPRYSIRDRQGAYVLITSDRDRFQEIAISILKQWHRNK